jgi:ribonuclease P protein subunit POP4
VELSKDNILCHELIGLRVKVLNHLDPSLEGVEGAVVWETTRSIRVDRGGKVVSVLKPSSILLVEIPGSGWVKVRGDDILGSPSERAKRMARGERCDASV